MYSPQRGSYAGATTLGVSEKWKRVLCYALGWLTGIVMLVLERRNETVRRHAKQSILVFGVLTILFWLVHAFGAGLGWIPVLGFFFGAGFGLIGALILLVSILAWIGFMLLAYFSPQTIFTGPRQARYL